MDSILQSIKKLLGVGEDYEIFDADIIKGALTKAVEKHLPLTDDCSAMDMMGVKTHTVEGDAGNIKLTEPVDMVLAEAILKSRGE